MKLPTSKIALQHDASASTDYPAAKSKQSLLLGVLLATDEMTESIVIMRKLIFQLSLATFIFLTLSLQETSSFGSYSRSSPRRRLTRHPSHLLVAQSDSQTQDKEQTLTNPLPPNVKEIKIRLDTGVNAQVFIGTPTAAPSKPALPPLVFIHGSFHAAWCWTEQFFSYFQDLGYTVVALSLRGTGGTFAGEGVKKVKIDEHAADVASFLNQVPSLLDSFTPTMKPVLVSHSFGGLAVMKYLEQSAENASNLSGLIIMCSVPPSGNGPMTMRFLKRSLRDSWKITVGFAMRKCIQNNDLCRDLFFGGDDRGVSNEDIARYQGYFARDTEAIIDIRDLLKHLPSKNAVNGKAPHVDKFPPCLVIGAERDFIVDREGVLETATYFGVDEPTFVDSPHDVMLGRNWENTASAVNEWVQTAVVGR